MSDGRPIRVGVIGLGFMGETHLRAYGAARAAGLGCEVVALCDTDRARAERVRAANAPDAIIVDAPGALLTDPRVDLVSVCTPTETHVALAMEAIRAEKHALVEKPIALTAPGVRPLAEAARGARTICMPAMCMRFWPGWDWLAVRVHEKTFGEVVRAEFRRLGPTPAWGGGFYQDHARSGGALIDFHIHDADFIRWLFGAPSEARCTGSLAHVTTDYRFAHGPERVTAEAGWLDDPAAPFRMEFRVRFERAGAHFMAGRDPALIVVDDRGSRAVDLPPRTGYDAQVRHMLALIRADAPARAPIVTMDDALEVARLLDAERTSLETGLAVSL